MHLIIAACVLIAGIYFSPAYSQQLIFKNYTVEDGLVSNPVRKIYQDSKGFIWIATWEGLSKYDGYKFTNFTTENGLSHNLVNDMYETGDGRMYVAENNGTVDVLQNDALFEKAVFRHLTINQFFKTQDQKLLVLTDSSGLCEIINGKLVKPQQAFPDSTYGDLAELNDSLMIGGGEGSLRILNRRLELFSQIIQPKHILTLKIYKDSKNRVWLGTNYGLQLLKIQEEKNKRPGFTLLPSPFEIPLLKERMVTDILEDDQGNLWITTTHGLVKINPDNTWQLLTENEGLLSSNISCISQDREKNIWIGTYLGLTKLVTKNSINVYKNAKESHAAGFDILVPVNNELFLTSNEFGIKLFNRISKEFTSIGPATKNYYGGIVQNSNPLLFYGNNNRFGKYDPATHEIRAFTLPGSSVTEVYCALQADPGTIFSGTQRGLVVHSGEKSWYENKLPYRITNMLIDRNGYLWVSTWSNGIFRIKFSILEKGGVLFTVEDFSANLPDKNIRCLFEDKKGNIWVGTRYSGVILLPVNAEIQSKGQRFDLKSGLMSNWTRTLTEDEKGNIWIGSNQGIDKLIPSGNSYSVFNFSRLNNYFANINTIVPGKDHSLWISTHTGIVNIIDGETENLPPPSIYITSVHLGDPTFNYKVANRNKEVILKHFQNQAEFEFSSPAFINEKQMLYSYRLGGSPDTAWSKPANLHKVSYASLQPGNYQFQVRTFGWNGEAGVPANFLFSIRFPYWQTWWFYLLVGLVLIFLLYAFYRYRIRHLLKLQTVRNRIATDLHDDIGSTLTNINMLSEISRKNLGDSREAEKFLYRITEEVTASSQALNDIIWSVNSRNDSMEEILSRMRRYAAELFDNSKTICQLSLDETVASKKLNMEQRRDLYLIYKESMNNIFKHASANTVSVNVHWKKGKLHLKINDDGKGFDPLAVTNRNGLRNIRARTEKWKGSTKIKTAPGQGTEIEIIIPLAG